MAAGLGKEGVSATAGTTLIELPMTLRTAATAATIEVGWYLVESNEWWRVNQKPTAMVVLLERPRKRRLTSQP